METWGGGAVGTWEREGGMGGVGAGSRDMEWCRDGLQSIRA